MERTLSHFSENSWSDKVWDVHVLSSGKTAKIRFPNARSLDKDILRATALSFLVQHASADAAQRVVREGFYFLTYLNESGLFIENIRTPIVGNYIEKAEIIEEAVNAGKNVMLFFSKYQAPENTIPAEGKSVEDIAHEIIDDAFRTEE